MGGIRGYPSIKYGDPDDLQDYKGGRSYDDLKKFAEGMGPSCGPANLDLCDDEKKAQIAKNLQRAWVLHVGLQILIFVTTRKKPRSQKFKQCQIQKGRHRSKKKRNQWQNLRVTSKRLWKAFRNSIKRNPKRKMQPLKQ